MGSEQEIRRVDHRKEPHRFEHQRGEDAEGGEHRDQRGEQQSGHDRALDLGARGEIGPQFEEGQRAAGKAEKQGDDNTDGAVISECGAVGLGQLPGQRIEGRSRRVDAARLRASRDNRVALEAEGGQLRGNR